MIELICLVSRLTTRTSNLVRSMFWKTIFDASGDQLGATCDTCSLELVVTCCGLWPAASTTQMRRGPAQEASTATRLPSGA